VQTNLAAEQKKDALNKMQCCGSAVNWRFHATSR